MIKRLLLVSLITLFVNCCFAQKNDTQDDCSHYYDKTTERNVYFNYTSAPVSPDSLPEGYLDYIYRNIKSPLMTSLNMHQCGQNIGL
jgi:hypothetical protein